MRKAKKWALIAAGSLAVSLGALGIALPLLPTTPFLLLAAFCYARGSPRFYEWLLAHRWLGEYIRNYREGLGVALRHKIVALILLWGTIGYSAGFVVRVGWVRMLLALIATAVTVHLLTLKTMR